MNKAIQLNKGDIIKDGVNYFFIFCALGSVIYVNPVLYVNSSPYYELEEILTHYRKIEIVNN